ncbi:hypothetical protein WICMUC_000486 [Wickerhamomyces mucosus]|uniref:Uncharacterized protein n=1 Tax=Wickerhamomyces mucosus TaxID=1378264 RepID=A0A9P8TIM8_9ASCO|nr:hypothetical protein WICMUC_000486 [Wickerhamomyces mucosus]
MTSASTPNSSFNCLAASKQNSKFLECETIVMSEPSLSILALPIGRVKSCDKTSSETSKALPYNNSFSKMTTGFGSLMAALTKPL